MCNSKAFGNVARASFSALTHPQGYIKNHPAVAAMLCKCHLLSGGCEANKSLMTSAAHIHKLPLRAGGLFNKFLGNGQRVKRKPIKGKEINLYFMLCFELLRRMLEVGRVRIACRSLKASITWGKEFPMEKRPVKHHFTHTSCYHFWHAWSATSICF